MNPQMVVLLAVGAERLARGCIAKQPYDRYNYRVLSDAGIAFASRFGDLRVLDETIDMMKDAEADIADPDFARDRRGLEGSRRRFAAETGAVEVDGDDALESSDDAILMDSEG